jgi:3',5'-cyclic AMP phosphodiesterase CpdA
MAAWGENPMFRLAHVSDLHATPVRVERVSDFANKRLLAWVSWRLKRSRIHRPEVLHSLVSDLDAGRPDHVVVTGDVTNASCPSEFQESVAWLERLGGPQRVSLVPGNHDATVAMPRARSWDHWSPYLGSDRDLQAPFPSLRVRGPVALVGVCSAVPTPPFLASGSVGAEQLERLEKLLVDLADTPLCRVLLIHHPPVAGTVNARRGLRDGRALRAMLRRSGADLVLHGHGHRTVFEQLEGPGGPIPVVGARSASYLGDKPHKRAQYHVYEIAPSSGGGARRFRIRVRVRGYEPGSGRFVSESQRSL